MSSGSLLATTADTQQLDLLARSVRFLSCGKLKRAAQLISEVNNAHTANSNNIQDIIVDCQRLGLNVQARKFLDRGDKLLFEGDYEGALRKYNLIGVPGLPKDVSFQVLHNKAVCMARLNLYGESVELFREAILRYPRNSIALENLAFALMKHNDFAAALQTFSEVIQIDEIQPGHLLHILYGAAECRQQLNMDAPVIEVTDDTLQNIQQYQQQMWSPQQTNRSDYFEESFDEKSYNDYEFFHSGQDFVQNVSHTAVTCNDRIAAHARRMCGVAAIAPESARQPYRCLRYQQPPAGDNQGNRGVFKSVENAAPFTIDTTEDVHDQSEGKEGKGPPYSPRSIHSAQKRDLLRSAVDAFDSTLRVASPETFSRSRAVGPLGGQGRGRNRETQPSPGQVQECDTSHDLKQHKDGSYDDRLRVGAGMSSSDSVSSAKPNFAGRRRPASKLFLPPLALHLLSEEEDPAAAKPPWSSSPVTFTTTPAAATPPLQTKLAPAVRISPPVFEPSPLPVPRWRPPHHHRRHAYFERNSFLPQEAAMVVLEDTLTRKEEPPATDNASDGTLSSSESVASQQEPAVDTPTRPEDSTPPPIEEIIVQERVWGISPHEDAMSKMPTSLPPPNIDATVQTSEKPGRLRPPLAVHFNGPTVALAHIDSTARTSAPADSSSDVFPRENENISSSDPGQRLPTHEEIKMQSSSASSVSSVRSSASHRTDRSSSPSEMSSVAGPCVASEVTFLTPSDGLLMTTSAELAPRAGLLQSWSEQYVSQHVLEMARIPATTKGDGNNHISTGSSSSSSSISSGSGSSNGSVNHPGAVHFEHHSTVHLSSLGPAQEVEHARSNDFYHAVAYSTPVERPLQVQQGEMDRAFESRRYVDNFTVTHADVLKMQAETERRFPLSPSGRPSVSYPYTALQRPGPHPPGVDMRIREMYLSEAEFQSLFHTSKTNFARLPEWRQRDMKKSLGLF